ncbi:MAG TPA: menaquinone biosynthesis protein [Candidatus Dormibacteraeota bacterium]|nr:menaquinone biosynthesis protein [Candidatus Dormibacteraeota bacterium]
MLRSGRIRYTNDLPIFAAFDEGAISYPGSLHEDVPTRLNAMLLAGELDLAPISAFAWARNADRLALLPDLCIGARDEVVSVVLVSQTPPALLDGTQIFVTEESASGRNLLRVLLERRYCIAPSYIEDADPLDRARHGFPALLIGDTAITALEEFSTAHLYDLGTLWHDWTGQQTVFAVWAARREIVDERSDEVRACMEALTDALTWSKSNMATVIAAAQARFPRADGFYEKYYGKLNFTFHSAARSGLAAFCRELYAIGAIPTLPPVAPEVTDAIAR